MSQSKKKTAKPKTSHKKEGAIPAMRNSKKLVIAIIIALIGIGSVVVWKVSKSNDIKAQAQGWSSFSQSGNTFLSCQTRITQDGVNGYSVRTKVYYPKTTNINTGINYMNYNGTKSLALVMFYGGGRGGTSSTTKTVFLTSQAYYVDGRVVSSNC